MQDGLAASLRPWESWLTGAAGGFQGNLWEAEEHVADALEGKSKAVFLVVQWLQFHIAMQGAPGSIP